MAPGETVHLERDEGKAAGNGRCVADMEARGLSLSCFFPSLFLFLWVTVSVWCPLLWLSISLFKTRSLTEPEAHSHNLEWVTKSPGSSGLSPLALGFTQHTAFYVGSSCCLHSRGLTH